MTDMQHPRVRDARPLNTHTELPVASKNEAATSAKQEGDRNAAEPKLGKLWML